MSVTDRVRPAAALSVEAEAVVARMDALRSFLFAVEGIVPEARLAPARGLVAHAEQRLGLSRAHTVVALVGATGSGKSSLFNALSRMPLSDVGLRRPTTAIAHACVWGGAGSEPLLDWLGVPPDLRFLRESVLDGDEEAALRGLVLLDLPDFDSIVDQHRAEAERLLGLVDVMVWVTDPQKYGDQIIHERYLRAFHRYREITVVVLNQADRLSPADAARCVADLRHLLKADGLTDVAVFPTSAVQDVPGLGELRDVLEKAVGARHASLRRLDSDILEVTASLANLVGDPVGPAETVAASAERLLADGLVAGTGLPGVADATDHAYRLRATKWLRWPPAWLWTRSDPYAGRPVVARRPQAPRPRAAHRTPAHAQGAAVNLAVRTIAEDAAAALPTPWPAIMAAAVRYRLAGLPPALDQTSARIDPRDAGLPWWPVGGVLQWASTGLAAVGLIWLAVRLIEGPGRQPASASGLAVPTLLLFGGLAVGALVQAAAAPLIRIGARQARARAERRLRASATGVAREYVLPPVREVLSRYEQARRALLTTGGTVAGHERGDHGGPTGTPAVDAGAGAGHRRL